MTQDGSPVNWTPVHFTTKKIYVAGGGMELDYKNTNPTGEMWQLDTARVYIPAPGGNAGAAELKPGATEYSEHRFVLYYYDHLGSIQAVAEYGSDPWTALPAWDRPKSRRALYSYDAWGQRRDPTDWLGGVGGQSTYTYGGSNDITPRGFTGHVPRSEATTPAGREAKAMLDNMGLVHLFRARRVTKPGREAEPEHGRIYDPKLGRFLSADPIIQAPGNLQNYNRYSYVLNNPLNRIDPSGYMSQEIYDAIVEYKRKAYLALRAILQGRNPAYLPHRAGEKDRTKPGPAELETNEEEEATSNTEELSRTSDIAAEQAADEAQPPPPAEQEVESQTPVADSQSSQLISTDYNKVVVAATLEARRMVASDNYIREYGGEVYAWFVGDLIYYSYLKPRPGSNMMQEVKDKSGKVVKVRPGPMLRKSMPQGTQGNIVAYFHAHTGDYPFSGGSFNVPGGDESLVKSTEMPLFLARGSDAIWDSEKTVIVQVLEADGCNTTITTVGHYVYNDDEGKWEEQQ